ncbi:restriction endonuclease PLD domain-containing protein [Veillonella criceti]|uniref:Restriction endonuclease type II NgoFVII C-terminal B3-like DNA-binding domain-containing protein n=1 Tax=Veillonella criceti TaxID=103891 RepID=A0A380NNB9_9FIRM|nr:restriction endonuclease PLD domain-containing protein [Veillonella criceti]SUP43762.1 Uncharacterised protein [Veillonella criceti]
MSIWEKYSKEEQDEYIKYLQIYGALSNLFRQKHGDPIPYLDSKFQETIYAKVFKSENVDIGNTPHDILSVFGSERIGIGLKTWMNSVPSFQKVMQLKRYKDEIDIAKAESDEALAYKLSEIKNERMKIDYNRLGLSEDKNIYHYITRDAGRFVIQETVYPLVDLSHLKDFSRTSSSFSWSDGHKKYRFTFSDSQIWQYFDGESTGTEIINSFDVNIVDDPFDFLLQSYDVLYTDSINFYSVVKKDEIVEAYLPLYSYDTGEVAEKSGLNAWNAAPKTKNGGLRPLNEVYIPIPIEFHRKYPDFFCKNILAFLEEYKNATKEERKNLKIRFNLKLPNGKVIPGLLTQDNMKAFQSGSQTERDPETGKPYSQAALGQWLLIDVLGLKERTLVTRAWLEKKGTDSVRLWRKKNDYSLINIDFAPINSFEHFMKDEEIQIEDN